MHDADQTIQALRSAVSVSPDNLPLRKHLADTLLGLGRPEEAEKEFKSALTRWPNEVPLKLGLATAFHRQAKQSAALVIVEDLLKQPSPPGTVHLLFCRLMLHAHDIERAVYHYKRAVEADGSLADAAIAGQLGIRTSGEAADQVPQDVVDGKVRAAADEMPADLPTEVERPDTGFRDVGGMETLKEEIRLKIIHPLKHPDLYKAYGKPIGGGILMYGPPGCGKTHLARATAGEISAGFVAVGINDVLDMWLGNSERNLHQVFEQARRNKPCVLFFDEVDALAANRTDMRTSAGRQLINQFLSELDGVTTSNEGVLVLAATNAPWHLDPAFRRPGRFDRIIFVPPPDAMARAAILRILVRGKPVADIDFDFLAKKSDHFSGADLRAIIDIAIEGKLKQAMRDGVPSPLTTKDMQSALATLKSSTREWFATAKNYALYANQGGTYDEVLKYLKL